MNPEAKTELKTRLLAWCRQHQEELATTARLAMETAQASANEQKGTMGDKFESFREQCQIDRDLFARQLAEHLAGLETLSRLDGHVLHLTVRPGAVVITDQGRFLVALSLGEILLDEARYVAISVQSPLCRAMLGKATGDTFTFGPKTYQVVEIF